MRVIVGVGIDVVQVGRFGRSLIRTPQLAERLFTPEERLTASGHPRSTRSLAARFAAKEAVVKALGAPAGLRWHDCVVVSDARGRPWLTVTGSVAAVARTQRVNRWHLSLTHDGDIASAMVVAEYVSADVVPADVVPADVVPADVVPADVVPADVVSAEDGPTGPTETEG